MYYKNKNNELYFEPSKDIISRDGLEEITEVEFNELLVIQNTPTPEQELQAKINEANQYLKDTDFYMTVDKYAELSDERKIELTTKRSEARELINQLELELKGETYGDSN